MHFSRNAAIVAVNKYRQDGGATNGDIYRQDGGATNGDIYRQDGGATNNYAKS